MTFDCRHGDPCHWGKADPVFISVRHRAPDVILGDISQISFTNLNGTGEGAINLHSEMAGAIRDISFNGLTFHQIVSGSDQQGRYDVRPPCNPQRPTGMGLDNAYWVDPQTGCAHGVERYPHGLPPSMPAGCRTCISMRSISPVPRRFLRAGIQTMFESTAAKSGDQNDKKSAESKLRNYVCYGLADVIGSGAFTLVSAWLLFFLTTFCGLTPIQAGSLFAVARIVDVIMCPVIGYVSDNFHKARLGRLFGRRRFFC